MGYVWYVFFFTEKCPVLIQGDESSAVINDRACVSVAFVMFHRMSVIGSKPPHCRQFLMLAITKHPRLQADIDILTQ